MGLYTCLFMNAKLKHDTPAAVIETLAWMVNRDQLETEEWLDKADHVSSLHDHPLFETLRWDMLMQGGSSDLDHFPYVSSTLNKCADNYYLVVQSSINHADDVIRLLCDWIGPFIDGSPGLQIGKTVCFDEENLGAIIRDRNTLAWIVKDWAPYDTDQSVVQQILDARPLIC